MRAAGFAALALLAGLSVQAADNPGLAGHWAGAIDLPGQKLQFDLDFSQAESAWKGDISIPLQNARDLPLTGIALDGDKVTFAIAGIPGNPTFQGTLAADGAKIAGTFTQGGGSFPFAAERAATGADVARQGLEGYDALVSGMIDAWKVPGLAVAIVKDGEVVYAKGFGYRDREKKLPVTPDTLFAIGSSTKAFTTFVLGELVDEGKLDWDKPVATFLPGFRLYDQTTTDLITPRDLVTHRSGLPRHDLVWYNATGLSRRELVERLPYLPPTYPLRAKFQYNNLMFLTAGYLAEQVTGKSWEDNVRERIFQPLGMTHSNFSVEDSQKTEDFALPYREDHDKVERIPFRVITNMGPAGSINSSVADMAKWVRVHLEGGKVDGRQLIGTATLADIHAPHMVIDESPDRPELSQPSYGLGWFVAYYRGHLRVEHAGNIDGFSALVTLLPQDHLGFVILTNKDGSGMPELLALHTLDRLLKLDPIDWNGDAIGRRDLAKANLKEAEAKKETVRKTGTKPAHKLEEYAGDYGNPGYGTLTIAVAAKPGTGLEIRYNGMSAPLEHWHYETWNGVKGGEPLFEDMKLLFETDVQGNVASVKAPFEPQLDGIVFTRKADAKMSDPAWLARFTGTYEVPGGSLTIELAGNTLTVNIPGQPQYHLVPQPSGDFVFKEVSLVRARFDEDAQGNKTLTLYQPNGVFTAKRTKG